MICWRKVLKAFRGACINRHTLKKNKEDVEIEKMDINEITIGKIENM